MQTIWLRLVLLLLLAVSITGCSPRGGCSPKDLFSWIDRNCFVADWTNHHSCMSCCNCKNGSCCKPALLAYPMVEFGGVEPDATVQ